MDMDKATQIKIKIVNLFKLKIDSAVTTKTNGINKLNMAINEEVVISKNNLGFKGG